MRTVHASEAGHPLRLLARTHSCPISANGIGGRDQRSMPRPWKEPRDGLETFQWLGWVA